MPAPVISGLITFISSQLNVTVFDGEVPRYDTAGTALTPETVTVPSDWPIVKVYMEEGGFTRTWTTEDAYDDRGEIFIQVWGTSRLSAETTMNGLEALLAQATNWTLILLGGPVANPYYVIHMLLARWYSGQEEGVRTGLSQLLYRCDMHYDAMIHGAISTF